MKKLVTMMMVFPMFLAGCEDKARPKYGECVAAAAKGDVLTAGVACEAAVKLDPTSTSGKAATDKLTAMQPAILKAKEERAAAEKKAAEERRIADEAAAKAAAEAQAKRVAMLKAKVKKKFWGAHVDGECTGKGLPPYKWDYEGGTFAEDGEVALADGCTKLHQSIEIQTYCCPQQPLAF